MKRPFDVLVCAPIMGRDLDPIRAVDESVNVIDGNKAFIAYSRARSARDTAGIEAATSELHDLLTGADVLCMMYPMLEDAAAHAPRLKWLHHTQAGVSNLWRADVWEARNITITSGRGHVRPTAIAEYCIAGALAFARGLHDGYIDKQTGELDRERYAPKRIAGSTMGVVGLGGIGKEVARLSKALGMRVVATRRSVESPQHDIDGADLLLPPSQLAELAAESDFIAVCAALTADTRYFLGADFFSAMSRQPILINVSRGEVIDETALLAALESGLLGGAVLDVYDGELERRPPRPGLMTARGLVLTPHISGIGSQSDPAFMALFCENLRRYIEGAELLNLVDRERGY